MTHSKIKDLYYSYFPNPEKYLTFDSGETNIILSAPHGGGIKPKNIPVREFGNKSSDTYTRRLTQRIVDLMDNKPFFIYSDIHRSRVDLNRDIQEAAQGNKDAELVWKEWNRILDAYLNMVRRTFKKGLYIDIHSHNNSNQFQIGYGFSVNSYLNVRNHKPVKAHSTMYDLKPLNPNRSEYYTLFGNGSIPRSLENAGYKVLVPEAENKYLNGGRNIKHFTGNGIGSIQIECPIPVLQGNLEGVAQTLVEAMYDFQERYL